MIGIPQAFSASYAQARVKFLEAAATAGLQIESHNHPLKGKDGEVLAMDVARDGPPGASKLLIVSSACHGVEGYCGSGVQVHALHDTEWLDKARDQGVAVLYVHALNPYGFSHIRRVTHENVDLNRNFHDFSKPLPVNLAYRELADVLVPQEWPPSAQTEAALGSFIQNKGMLAFQAAFSAGQYEFPKGMFFGGTAPTWSNQTFRQVLRSHGAQAQAIAWIDLHTGLGPNGLGERIFACADDAAALKRARAWWDGGGATPVTSIYDGSSTSALLNGLMWMALNEECPNAEYTGIAMEYGTVPVMGIAQALRAEHWLDNHPEAPAHVAAQIKQQLMDAFYTDTDSWKGQIIAQARQSMFQAVDGLSGSKTEH
jgi:Protein of unknown function (DUF2817)